MQEDAICNAESRIEVLEGRLRHAKWENVRLRTYLRELRDTIGIELPSDIEMLVEIQNK